MDLSAQIFPLVGRVVGIVFTLPSSFAFEAAHARGRSLNIEDVRRTIGRAGSRSFLVIAHDPAGSVIDGQNFVLVVSAAGRRYAIDLTGRLAWQWSAAVKTGLAAVLQSWQGGS